MDDFTMEHVTIGLLRSQYLLDCIHDGRSEQLAIKLRNLTNWSARWQSRLLGFRNDTVIFVCPPGPQTAVEMLRYMMDRIPPSAGVVDVVRLPIQITGHGLWVSPDAISRGLDLLTDGALMAAPPAADVLQLDGNVVQQSNSGASLDPLGSVPTSYEDHTPFKYMLGRTMDDVMVGEKLWPVPTHPLWLLVGLLVLGFNGELLKPFVGLVLVGIAVALCWWKGYEDAISPLVGVLHVWAVINARGNFAAVAALTLVPGGPGVTLTLLAALFAARRTTYLVLLGAMAGYATYCDIRRRQTHKTLLHTVARLVSNHERVNADFTNLWRTHIPDLVEMEPTALDGWFVLQDIGRRAVAFCPMQPASIPDDYHVVHALTGGCWVIGPETLPADVSGAMEELREVVGLGSEVEVCAPRLLVLGGDVLVVTLFGPTRAIPRVTYGR
jgi:hypothetical protein